MSQLETQCACASLNAKESGPSKYGCSRCEPFQVDRTATKCTCTEAEKQAHPNLHGLTCAAVKPEDCRCPVRPYAPSMASGSSWELRRLETWQREHGAHRYAQVRDSLAGALQQAEGAVGSGQAVLNMVAEVFGLESAPSISVETKETSKVKEPGQVDTLRAELNEFRKRLQASRQDVAALKQDLLRERARTEDERLTVAGLRADLEASRRAVSEAEKYGFRAALARARGSGHSSSVPKELLSEANGLWQQHEEARRLANELCCLLTRHCGEGGRNEGARECLERLLKELMDLREKTQAPQVHCACCVGAHADLKKVEGVARHGASDPSHVVGQTERGTEALTAVARLAHVALERRAAIGASVGVGQYASGAKVQPPSVGRMVHFHEEGGPYTAIITALNADGTVELCTFGRNSVYFQHGKSQSPEAAPVKGTWSWMPHVPAVPEVVREQKTEVVRHPVTHDGLYTR